MEYLLIICSLAVGHGLFMAITLLILDRKLSNRLLAFLLFLLAVRVGKSVLQLYLKPDMSYATSVAGVMAMACIGPVLLMLVKSLFSTGFRITLRQYIHFAPVVILPALLFSGWKFLSLVYYTITFQVVVYAAWSWLDLLKNRETYRADDLKWRWALMLVSAVSILTATFILQVIVYEPVIYTTNVIVAALLFYGLSLWAIRRAKLFLAEPSAKPENVTLLNELGERIQLLFDREHIYTDSALTVSALAARLKVPAYLASKAINHHFSKTFSELVLRHRLNRAAQLLRAPDSGLYTIEAIAFESGFSTLSAFYAAFKRCYHTTPAQFRTRGVELSVANK